MKIAVIGAGLIGQAWAIVFARGGCDVHLWDGDEAALQQALVLVGAQVHALRQQGLLDDPAAVMARIRICAKLESAVVGAAYIQESLPEHVELKAEIFQKLDAMADPEAILASSTSSIPASAFTRDLPGQGRCLVAHPVNPPYLIPVVELCGAPWTTDASMEQARAIMRRVGQKPVLIHKEMEGFVLNRLQGALLREAFRLVQAGCISVEDLDVTVKDGLGLRWAFMGPFETIDLNAPDGLQDYCQRYGGMYRSISTEQTSTDEWRAELVALVEKQRRDLLPKSDLPSRRQWRDDRLMALVKHKRTVGFK